MELKTVTLKSLSACLDTAAGAGGENRSAEQLPTERGLCVQHKPWSCLALALAMLRLTPGVQTLHLGSLAFRGNVLVCSNQTAREHH